jgi:Copper amine oxidase, enzyme domain
MTMKQYMLSVHDVEGTPKLSAEEIQKSGAQVDALNNELQAEGVWVFGGGLNPASTATVVRSQDGEILTTDGPFAEYNGNACGPYRDWQYQEGMIRADGVDVAPGFRICSSPPRTIMDTGSDSGTFLGVGLHTTPNEIVLVSEMEAGWYRYVSEWRLGTDGRISPRFGFAAVESSCVCNVHHHHVYWRFDFDVGTAANNRVREFNDPPLVGSSKWHTLQFEARRARRPNRNRRWRVVNTVSGDAYAIIPRHDDGLAAAMPDAPFGRGDLWVLQYKPGAEIDDGVVAVGPPYEAGIDAWVNGEPVHDHDVVVWYAGHFTHDTSVEDPAQHGHIVGPDLKPVSW